MKPLLFVILFIFLLKSMLLAQFTSTQNISSKLEMKFLKPKIEAAANESFFNILTIKNNSNQIFKGKLRYNAPSGWEILGEKEITINIQKHDSINLPVRIIVSKTVMGEIAYAVIATLNDNNNRPVLSEYCFINVPRISDLHIIAPNNKTLYFDNKTNLAKFQYKILNKGNTNEIIQLNLEGSQDLSISDKKLNEPYVFEYSVPAHTDTVINIAVKLENDNNIKTFLKLKLKTYTLDSLYQNNLWLSKIENYYEHFIPIENKCAIVELTASDIFSTRTPQYSLMLMGNILLKKNTDLYYYFRSNTLSNINYYSGTKAYIGVKTPISDIKVGTVENIFNEHLYGYGSVASVNTKKISVEAHYAYNENLLQTFYGGQAKFSLFPKADFEIGYTENSIERYRNYTEIIMGALNFAIKEKHRFGIKTYLNNTTHAWATPFEKQGYAILGNYTGNFKNFKAYARVEYGSPDYSGISKGKFILNSNLNYLFKNYDFLNLSYFKNDQINLSYINDVEQPTQKIYYDSYELTYNKYLNKNMGVSFGGILKNERFNLPYLPAENVYFSTLNPRVMVAFKIKNAFSNFYFKPKIDIGQIITTQEINTKTNPYLTFNVNLYATYKYFGLFGQYRNGPYGIYAQYYYNTYEYFTKWLVVIPTYNRTFFDNLVNVDLRGNYRYDINTKNKYISFATQLQFYLKNSWTIRFLTSTSSYSKYDAINNYFIKYNSTYFEAGIRKEFNCKQPRFQYYNLKVVFFKDLNGNRKKEPNEPGLRNVLASIERDYSIENNVEKKDFVSIKLLSGGDGTIIYDNIVNGSYLLKYVLIGDMVGNFNREEMTYPFKIEKNDTIFIPYLEDNRIIGKVILNRDPLSALGNIDVANIRITAEDTHGHSYSALTDKDGEFIIYAPVTDHYIVKINNIFYESFDIEQPEYIVKFNGYKQFEVTFVFNEKKRKINFDNKIEEEPELEDIQLIRKTTLTGKVRDAITLEPIEAEIKIINNNTNQEITRAVSNKITGNYSISYVAGPHYRMEVKANGYWEHVENLYIEQVISIQNINKDIMLNKLGDDPEAQKTFILYKEKEQEFTQTFKPGQQIPMNYLNFDQRQTRLSPEAYPELDRLLELLNKNKSVKIEIAGYSDDQSNERVEKIIAKRRAEAVARYLMDHGLSENRITIKSYGNTRPLVPGANEKARKKNRRVEIIVR